MFLYFQNAYLYLSVGLIFIVGASLLLHMVLYAESFMWVPRHTKDTLFISAVNIKKKIKQISKNYPSYTNSINLYFCSTFDFR